MNNNSFNQDFDKRIKKAKRKVAIVFIITIFMLIATFTAITIVGIKVVNAVIERGAKDVLEKIWNGPDE